MAFVSEDSSTQKSKQLARELINENGRLISVNCTVNPKTITLNYSNGFVSENNCDDGFFMQFGYMGTGTSCFWAFLNTSDISVSYDELIELKSDKVYFNTASNETKPKEEEDINPQKILNLLSRINKQSNKTLAYVALSFILIMTYLSIMGNFSDFKEFFSVFFLFGFTYILLLYKLMEKLLRKWVMNKFDDELELISDTSIFNVLISQKQNRDALRNMFASDGIIKYVWGKDCLKQFEEIISNETNEIDETKEFDKRNDNHTNRDSNKRDVIEFNVLPTKDNPNQFCEHDCKCSVCQEIIEAFDEEHDPDERASFTDDEKIKEEVTYSYDDILSDYILNKDHPKEYRILAMERATVVEKIQKLVMDEDDLEICLLALERLIELDGISSCVDDDFYSQVALAPGKNKVRLLAIKNIVNSDVLVKLINDDNKQIRNVAKKALGNIRVMQNINSQDSKELVEMVYANTNVKLQKKAVKQIIDKNALKEIALNHSDTNIRQEAIEQITDKDILIEIFRQSSDWDRETAKTRLVTLFDIWM